VTDVEAMELARKVALEEGWPWEGPIRAMHQRRGWFGPRCWNICSNAECRGRNVWISIDEATGSVLSSRFSPR
jgi:hypothetical protein